VFEKMYKYTVKTTAYLTVDNAKEEIDRVIDVMANTKLPVYLALPVDVCCHCIDDIGYDVIHYEKSDPNNLKSAFEKTVSLLKSAKNPVFMVDYLVKRFKLQNYVKEFIENTNIPFTPLLMGKGAISECSPHFIGMNMGNLSYETVIEEVKKADLIMTAGFLNADLNTGGFTVLEDKKIDIKIEKNSVTICGETCQNVLIQDFIKLLADIKDVKFNHGEFIQAPEIERTAGELKVDDIFVKIEHLLSNGDIFLMETGLMSLSGAYLKLKCDMEYLSQTLWGSIGWATPASFGASVANKEKGGFGETILFTGEGAHQLTIQEMANFFELNFKPVIFVLNNGGYTVERVLSKDFNDKFNDITNWDYLKIIEGVSNGKDYYAKRVNTVEEFDKTIEELKNLKGKKLCYIELTTASSDITKLSPKLVQNIKNFAQKLDNQKFSS